MSPAAIHLEITEAMAATITFSTVREGEVWDLPECARWAWRRRSGVGAKSLLVEK